MDAADRNDYKLSRGGYQDFLTEPPAGQAVG